MQNFVFSTELVALIMGVIVIYFAVHNECIRSRKLSYLMTTAHAIMTCTVFEIAMQFISHAEQGATDVTVSIFGVGYVVLHLFATCGLLIYVQNLSEIRYDIHKINRIILAGMACFLIIGLVLAFTGHMYHIEDGYVYFDALVPYTESIAIIATVISFFEVLLNKKRYPLTIYRYIRLFMPGVLGLQILQFVNKGIIFNAIIYMSIVMILFFLYHNENYNSKTGGRTNVSFEAHMEKIFKKKMEYDLLFIRLDMDMEAIRRDNNRELHLLWKYCRLIEYSDSKVFLYNIEEDMYAVLCANQNKAKRQKFLQTARELCNQARRECEGFVTFMVYHYENNEVVHNLSDLKTYAGFLAMEKGKGDVYGWNDPPQDSYERFVVINKVYMNLVDIVKKCDPKEPRVLCYAQPIYRVASKDFKSAEALMRLKLDDGIVSPAVFIPIVEQMGGMHALTVIMLHKVCAYIKENSDLDFSAITINCSPYELNTSGFAKEILDIIAQYGVNPSMIRLELTEGAEARRYGTVAENMSLLYDAGIRFYLDDFGTGYSNISKLLQYNIHTIKFDKSMLYQSMKDDTLCQAVAALAKSFHEKGTHILVEGVEDGTQEELACQMGFEYIQGFKFAKPVPIENLKEYFVRK